MSKEEEEGPGWTVELFTRADILMRRCKERCSSACVAVKQNVIDGS